jgi:hypothetical protein
MTGSARSGLLLPLLLFFFPFLLVRASASRLAAASSRMLFSLEIRKSWMEGNSRSKWASKSNSTTGTSSTTLLDDMAEGVCGRGVPASGHTPAARKAVVGGRAEVGGSK